MQYLVAKYKMQQDDYMLSVYLTDILKVLNENVADIVGGKIITERYWDKINTETETRTADDIITDIKSGLEELNGRI